MYKNTFKKIFNLSIFTFFCLIPNMAFSFYSHQNIDNIFRYENLEIERNYSLKLKGKLINKSADTYTISANILFCNIHKTVLNSTTIYKTIQPHSEVTFSSYLKNKNYDKTRHAHHVKWNYRIISTSKKEKVHHQTPERPIIQICRNNRKIQRSKQFHKSASKPLRTITLKNGKIITFTSYCETKDNIIIITNNNELKIHKSQIAKFKK